MRYFLSVLTVAAMCGAVPVHGEEPPTDLKYPDTGTTRAFTVEPSTEAPVLDPTKFDEDTARQVEALQRKLDRHGPHPAGPGLKVTVPFSPEDLVPNSPESRAPGQSRGPMPINLFTVGSPSVGAQSSRVNEPSVVVSGDRVFFTGNWYSVESTDGGNSFSGINPFTGPFAPVNGGFCCDQTSDHDDASNASFYLQQYISDAAGGTHRINVDQGSDGTWDCFYDTTPQALGFAAGDWADYPDLAVSDNFLYHSSNVFSGAGSFTGSFVVRYPMADLTSCSAIATQSYVDTGFGSMRFTRGAGTTMYFADHISLTSVRIWSWPDAAAAPTSVDRTVALWSNSNRVCPGPDGRDWCGFIDSRIQSGYVADGRVGFLWQPAQGGAFPFPYTRVARFTEAGMTAIDNIDLWSADHAMVYGSVAVNSNGDLGGTMMYGGGTTLHPSCGVWVADDANGDVLAPLDLVSVIEGTVGPSSNRSGDYTLSRVHYPDSSTWVGACFAYETTGAGSSRYVHFGRDNDTVFRDGFEAGSTANWTATIP